MNNEFLITSVSINNFRGFDSIDFEFFKEHNDKKGLILLSGPNGYGKTTLLDSIEWCLTGSIYRVKDDFDRKKEDTKTMQVGLIRNSQNISDVSVTITGKYLGENFTLKRLFNGDNEADSLIPSNTFVYLNDNKQNSNFTIDNIINRKISNRFYENYTCSYEKNIRVYEKSRDDIYKLFSEFLGGTREIEMIISNLEGTKKVPGVIGMLEAHIKKELNPRYTQAQLDLEKINNEYVTIISERDEVNILGPILYPEYKSFDSEIFPNEILNNNSKTEDKHQIIRDQINILKKIKFINENKLNIVTLRNYIEKLKVRVQYKQFIDDIYNPYNNYKEILLSILNKNIDEIDNNLNSLEDKLVEVKDISKFNKDNYFKVKSMLLHFSMDENQGVVGNSLPVLDSLILEFDLLYESVKEFDTTDEKFNALRLLVDNKESFEHIRQSGDKDCPLCGSDSSFSNYDVELTKVAKEILGDFDTRRAEVKGKLNRVLEEINKNYEHQKNYLQHYLEEQINKLKSDKLNFKKTQTFRNNLPLYKLNLTSELEQAIQDIQVNFKSLLENTTDLENTLIENIKNSNGYLEWGETLSINGEYIDIPKFISLEDNNKIDRLNVMISIYNEAYEFLKDKKIQPEPIGIQNKIQYLENLLITLKYDDKTKKIETELEKAKVLVNKELDELNNSRRILTKLSSTLTEIKKTRKKWDHSIMEQISNPLQNVYKRINRHSNIETINVLIEGRSNAKANLVTHINNEKKPAANVLSAGQLSVAALSIFLTVALGQANQNFKCYFMDEPIQTMDDLNILSFVDLLRAEFSENNSRRFIDQLFFTTCDENLEKLILHKMKHFNVNCCHIKFSSIGQYN
jgi:DNA repair exonuclease SbcCD ATPase subunit